MGILGAVAFDLPRRSWRRPLFFLWRSAPNARCPPRGTPSYIFSKHTCGWDWPASMWRGTSQARTAKGFLSLNTALKIENPERTDGTGHVRKEDPGRVRREGEISARIH